MAKRDGGFSCLQGKKLKAHAVLLFVSVIDTVWSVNSAKLIATGLDNTPPKGLISLEEERSTVYFSPPSHLDAVLASGNWAR